MIVVFKMWVSPCEVPPGNPLPVHRRTSSLTAPFALLFNERFALPRHGIHGKEQRHGPGIEVGYQTPLLTSKPSSLTRSKSVAIATLARFFDTTTWKTNKRVHPRSKHRNLPKTPYISILSCPSHAMNGAQSCKAPVGLATPSKFVCICKHWLCHTRLELCLCTPSMVEKGNDGVKHQRTTTVWLAIRVLSPPSTGCNTNSWSKAASGRCQARRVRAHRISFASPALQRSCTSACKWTKTPCEVLRGMCRWNVCGCRFVEHVACSCRSVSTTSKPK